MLKKFKTNNSSTVKFLGMTVYKRIQVPNKKTLIGIITIEKDNSFKRIRIFGVRILKLKNEVVQPYKSIIPITNFTNHVYKKWFEPFLPSDNDWLDLPSAKYNENTRCVVILPVYKGYEETLCSLYHALKNRNNENYSLLVINDCGPDQQLNDKLLELSKNNLFDYHVNQQNLGFVKTINLAISKLSHDLDVILLNSDAFVFDGWFNRLIAYTNKDESIATITPLSNNATICSYPYINADNCNSLELQPNELDEMLSNINSGVYVEAPTGVGFCFYMSRKAINEIGLLDDKSFKVGYGEENDFCMRAIHHGYKNIICTDVFVYHVGSVSFSETKHKNMQLGEAALNLKHPNYNYLVEMFIKSDPLYITRRYIDLYRLSKIYKNCTVFITHKWGGGIQTYLNQIVEEYTKNNKKIIILEVHDIDQVTIKAMNNINNDDSLVIPNLNVFSLTKHFNFLNTFFKIIKPSLVHINSFAGLNWSSHKKLLTFFTNSKLNYKFIVHDYASMSCNYKLLSPAFEYQNIPSLATRFNWEMELNVGSYEDNVADPYERRDVYYDFFKSCNEIEAPSNRAKEILLYDFPDLNINVKPHKNELIGAVLKVNRKKEDNLIKIASIGALSIEKGVEILYSLSKIANDDIKSEINIAYSLIGCSDGNYTKKLKKNNVLITGHYKDDYECCKLINDISPDLIFLPSICEETYSYTLSVALALKIPTIIFNIGAPAERTKDLDWVIKLDPILMKNPHKISQIIKNLDIDYLWNKSLS